MTKTRLLALPLTLALALAGATAVLADSHEDAAFDLSSIPEVNQDEALILFHQMRENLLAAGVSEGDIGAAVDSVEAEYGNISEADMDELLAAQMLEDRDGGDDEFGRAEEDELISDDDEEEDDG